MGGNRPPMPERVDDIPVAITVELVLRRTLELSAELHCLFDYRVDILDVQEEREWRPFNTFGLRRLGAAVGKFILDNEHRIANLNLGVSDRLAWTWKPHTLRCSKYFIIECKGFLSTFYYQRWGNSAIACWNRVGS